MAYALGMKINEIKVGIEVRINGVWAVVDAIEGTTVWAIDQDGGDIEAEINNVEIA